MAAYRSRRRCVLVMSADALAIKHRRHRRSASRYGRASVTTSGRLLADLRLRAAARSRHYTLDALHLSAHISSGLPAPLGKRRWRAPLKPLGCVVSVMCLLSDWSRITRKPEVEPPQPREPPPAGHLSRRCPARHPAAIRRATWIHGFFFPSQLGFRCEYEALLSSPAQRLERSATILAFCPPLVTLAVLLLQPVAVSVRCFLVPAAPRVILADGERPVSISR